VDALERRCPFLIQHSDVSKHVWGIRVKNTVVGLVNQMQIAPRRTQAARWPDSVEKQECRKLAPDSCRAPLVSVDLPSTPAWGFHPRPHDTSYRLCCALRALTQNDSLQGQECPHHFDVNLKIWSLSLGQLPRPSQLLVVTYNSPSGPIMTSRRRP